MRGDTTMKIMIGCCGLDCETCDAYLATIRNDDALREKTAKLWSEMNQTEIRPEWINCEGCRADGVKTFFCTNQCEIRKCALDKGFETCGDCAEMAGCETVKTIQDHVEDAAKNLQ